MNERIRAPRVRVVLPDGQQLGIMSSKEALEKAKIVGLDLVEIAAKADPPVCRIIDYGKYKYEQAKLKKQQKTNTKNVSRMKEVKFRVRTEQHDYNIKLNRLETFLDDGHKSRVILQFRGRENAHRDIGFVKMDRIIEDLKTMATVDQPPRLSGRVIGMLLTPLPKAQRKRRFQLFHGELMDQDDFEEVEDGDEDVISDESEDADVSDEAEETDVSEDTEEAPASAEEKADA